MTGGNVTGNRDFEAMPKHENTNVSIPDIDANYELVKSSFIRCDCSRILFESIGNMITIRCQSCRKMVSIKYNKKRNCFEMVK